MLQRKYHSSFTDINIIRSDTTLISTKIIATITSSKSHDLSHYRI